ncbi:MAG: DNA primase [Paludibacteraceae bacterium]|nr:DNA primase [Paludibacteraceae bacterium]
MIDRQTVDKILDAAQIVDVVSDFVTLRKRGVNYIGLCPFHDEKTGSFTVSPAKGIFKCFGCGKGGGPVHFIMEHEQLDYPGALRYLAKKYHIEIVEKEMTPEEQQSQSDREAMFALNTWAQSYFTKQMNETDEGRAIGLSYFHSRGFTDETIEKFGLGYCLDKSDVMTMTALNSGYKADFIEKCGLGNRRDNGTWYDRFRGRVMFPVHTLSGKVVAFGGRVLKKDDKTAKYVNSPESEIYHKSNELYGIYFAKQSIVKQDRCFLVEGYTDVISMHQAGITNVVASSGTSLTPGQIRLIHRFTPNITVLYDGDAAGIKASIRGIDLLLEEGMNVKVVLLPDGEDPDSYAQNNNASDFIDFIDKNQVDFIRFKIQLLLDEIGNDPIKKAGLIQDVVHSISLIPDNIVRSVYAKECATQLDIDEKVVLAEIQKILRVRREKELVRKSNGDYTPQSYATEEKHDTNPLYRQENVVSDGERQMLNPQLSTFNSRFDKEEMNILHYVVRYGGEVLFEVGDGEFQTVSGFVVASLVDLEVDGGKIFHNPLHQRMLDCVRNVKAEDNFNAAKHFTNHIDPEISAKAAELLTDKYTLSKMHTKQDEYSGDPANLRAVQDHQAKLELQKKEILAREVNTVIHEYKAAIISEREREIDQKIKQAQESGNFDEIMDFMRQKQIIIEHKKALSKEIGGRVVLWRR